MGTDSDLGWPDDAPFAVVALDRRLRPTPPPVAHFGRQGLPGARVPGELVQKAAVRGDEPAAADVIRVRQENGHPAALPEETCLFDPHALIAMSKQVEERVILHQRDRQLDHVPEHVRQPGATTAGLRLEGCRVREGGVVLEPQLRHELGRAKRPGRPKAACLPTLCVGTSGG